MSRNLRLFVLTALLLVPVSAQATQSVDLVVAMDGSGSVGAADFQLEKDFVEALLASVAPQNGSVASSVIVFASGAVTRFDLTPITAANALTIGTVVQNIPYPAGLTFTDDAINEAISQFDGFGSPGADRVLFLITEGNPTSGHNPCLLIPDLDSRGIRTVIGGFGDNWDPSTVNCLVNDEATEIVFLDNHTADTAAAALALFPVPAPSLSPLGIATLCSLLGLAGLRRLRG